MKKALIFLVLLTLSGVSCTAMSQFRNQRLAGEMSDHETVFLERGTLATSVEASGVLHSNQRALLTWQTQGTIGEISVNRGDHVTKGQVLAELVADSLSRNVILARVELSNAQDVLDDLMDHQLQRAQALFAVERAQQNLEDALQTDLIQAQAFKALIAAQGALEDAERILTIVTAPVPQSAIDQAYANMLLAENALAKTRTEFERIERKLKKNPNTYNPWESRSLYRKIYTSLQLKLAQDQNAYERSEVKHQNLLNPVDPYELILAETDLAVARAQLARAQKEWERVKDGPNETQIAILEAQLIDAQSEWESRSDGPDASDISVAESRIAAAQAALSQVYITAPFDGVLTEILGKPGDQVRSATRAFRLDDLTHLLLDVEVSEIDIFMIEVGQDVQLTFDAVQGQEYLGEVVEVAAVGTEFQGVVNFKATVELKEADASVKPGMTAEVSIIVSQLEDVLLVPNRAVRYVDGARVVYVLGAGGVPGPVEVILGASSGSYSELLGGDLKDDDQILLKPAEDS